MDNLTKFSTPNKSDTACKRDSLAIAAGASANIGHGIASSGDIDSPPTPPVSAHTSTWLAALHVNNNNNTDKSYHHVKDTRGNLSTSMGVVSNIAAGHAWQCDSCDLYQTNGAGDETAMLLSRRNTLAKVALIEEDEGGGCSDINKISSSLNGKASANAITLSAAVASIGNDAASSITTAASVTTAVKSLLQSETDYDAYDMCGAASLSPPLMEDPFDDSEAAAALGGGHSNRTSLNNSTENLSYTSDNFYGDDLILLGEDGDLEAEELSLNSDDCIYAYRGAGAEFDLLPPLAGMPSNFGLNQGNIAQEEETDFLEMDFDPDPPSELEYNHSLNMGNSSNDAKVQFLMQRDSCHLVTPTQRHQLFSSPIDDLPSAPKALQAQSLLTKNFARITLHLDQIQKDYIEEHEDETRERLNSALDSRPLEDEFVKDLRAPDTSSHSLPNTLHEHFTNRCNSESAVTSTSKEGSLPVPLPTIGHTKSPSKITGAKPKRLSTFSSTSSTSSKNSSKSRNSLRSAFQSSTLGTSSSFDERSVSCSEFRTERDLSANTAMPSCKQPSLLLAAPLTAPSTASSLLPDLSNFNDETCLDCLEKEFLANTIGKALDPLGCSKCRKRLGHNSVYNNRAIAADHNTVTSKYRRSASPTTTFFFNEQASTTSRLFSCEFLNSQARKRQEWDSYMQEQKETPVSEKSSSSDAGKDATLVIANNSDKEDLNQSFKDIEMRLFKNLKPPDPCMLTISTINLTESSLVQALDKLQIAYSQELLKNYFKNFINNNINYNNLSSSSTNLYKTSQKEFHNLKEFLMYVSKAQANYHKLKRLIGKLTQNQILVQFKKDSTITELEMVPVKVSDILHYWSQCKNLECLKEMDQRFLDANILGKIANIIRQAHQRSSSSSRRPLTEFISIPQYYPSGFLTLTNKKC